MPLGPELERPELRGLARALPGRPAQELDSALALPEPEPEPASERLKLLHPPWRA